MYQLSKIAHDVQNAGERFLPGKRPMAAVGEWREADGHRLWGFRSRTSILTANTSGSQARAEPPIHDAARS